MDTFEDLLSFAQEHGPSDAASDSLHSWLRAFARVTEPEVQLRHEYITMHSTGGGVSRKPGNIVLNWRRLFDVAPDAGVAASAYATSTPFVRGLIGLYVWNKVWRGSEEELSDIEASVIETLWVRYGRERRVSGDTAFEAVNDSRRAAALSEVSRSEFERAVDRLVRMACVKLDDGNIWLREWVRRRT